MFVRKTQTLLVASAIAAVSGIALAQDGPAANMSFFLTSVGSGDGDYALAPGTYRVVLAGSELRAERELVVPREREGTVAVPLELTR